VGSCGTVGSARGGVSHPARTVLRRREARRPEREAAEGRVMR
jgi:hypothetical protein